MSERRIGIAIISIVLAAFALAGASLLGWV